MVIDKSKLQPLLWAVVGAWKAGDQGLQLHTDALDEFLVESTVEEVALSLLDEVDRLQTENDVLRKDAERYQWLRDKQTFIWLIQDWFPSDATLTDVDGEISAAMAKESSHD